MEPITYHTDPGHGWFEVKRAELERLGIVSRISSYSYQRGATAYLDAAVYLEEDCDASIYFAAVLAETGREPDFVEKHTDGRSPIRSYETFKA